MKVSYAALGQYAKAPPSIVQSVFNGTASGTTATATFPNPTLAGSTIFVFVGNNNAATITTASTGFTVTFTNRLNSTYYTCYDAINCSAGITGVTVTTSVSTSFALTAIELSGVIGYDAGTLSASGANATSAVCSTTTTHANDIVLACDSIDYSTPGSVTTTVSSPYVMLPYNFVGYIGHDIAHINTTTAGSQSATFTFSTAVNIYPLMVSYYQ